MGHHRPLGHRAHPVPRLWRSRGRHIRRGGPHACAHQHARRADVGEGNGAADDDRAVRAAARHVVECGDAAAARDRSVLVQRAQSAVPDGQSGRVQPVLDADVHRARREPHAGVPSGGASHRHRGRARHPRARRAGDRARSQTGVPRVSALREQHVHVYRRLPAVGQRRRHGAPEQHGADLLQLTAHQPARSARHDLARVLSLVEHRANPPAVARAVQPRRGEHLGRTVARRRIHQLLRRVGHEAQRPCPRARLRARHGRGHRHRHQ